MPSIADFTFVRLSPDMEIGAFGCGDDDLDGFLRDDARDCLRELLAVTYLFRNHDRVAAFFSVLNDKIVYEKESLSTSAWRRFLHDKLPHPKRGYESYPSVKLGRLGVISLANVEARPNPALQDVHEDHR